jgi:hypothetical protein
VVRAAAGSPVASSVAGRPWGASGRRIWWNGEESAVNEGVGGGKRVRLRVRVRVRAVAGAALACGKP